MGSIEDPRTEDRLRLGGPHGLPALAALGLLAWAIAGVSGASARQLANRLPTGSGDDGTLAAPGPERPAGLVTRGVLDVRERLESSRRAGTLPPRSTVVDPEATVTVLVRLEGPPALAEYGRSLRAGRSRSAAVAGSRAAAAANRALQAEVRGDLARLGARELYSVQKVLNAMVIRVRADTVDRLRSTPGVRSVEPAPIHVPTGLATSLPYVKANATWSNLVGPGATGSGVTIAVIDTGIDYLHATFGGSGDYAGQTDATVLSDTPLAPSKVIDGYDFAGDSYNAAESANATPTPDDDPTDCSGHGTHVAGIAAGFGIDSGATYTGGYGMLMKADLAALDLAPGVAPEADLVALKIFGCDGSTALSVQAIEHAVDPDGNDDPEDRYDVILVPLGSDYGVADGATEEAAENAALAGAVVVASAGNDGQRFFVVNGPGAADRAISVASILHEGDVPAVVTDLQSYPALLGQFSPALEESVPASPANVGQPSVDEEGCSIDDFESFGSGDVALIARGTCLFADKVENAQDNGASAVIVGNVTTNVPFAMAGESVATIPSVMISGTSYQDLVDSLPQTAQLVPAAGGSLVDTVSGSSALGPRRSGTGEGYGPKPDLAAPGVGITSAQTGYLDGPGDDTSTLGGASMAAAHVAGAVALLRGLYPAASVEEIKAAIMNTAKPGMETIDLVSPGPTAARSAAGPPSVGAGALDVLRASTAGGVFVYAAGGTGAVGVAFTADAVGPGSLVETREVTVANKGGSPVSYDVSFTTLVDASGIALAAVDSSVAVASGGTTTIEVEATFDPSAMLLDLDPALFDNDGSNSLHWLSYEAGLLELVPSGGGDALLLPVSAFGRPASSLTAGTASVQALAYPGGTTGEASIVLDGQGVSNTTLDTTPSGYPLDQVSKVAVFELLWESEKISASPDLSDSGDLRRIGIASDVAEGGITSFVGIETWDAWGSPRERQLQILVDLDQDGTDDWVFVGGIDDNDRFMTLLWDVNGFLGTAGNTREWGFENVLNAEQPDTRLFGSDVVILPFETSSGFWGPYVTSGSDLSEAFDFRVKSYSLSLDLLDTSPTFTVDPMALGVRRPGGVTGPFGEVVPLFEAASGSELDLDVSVAAPGDPVDLLLLHLYNEEGARGEVVSVETALGGCGHPVDLLLVDLTIDDEATYTGCSSVIGGGTAAVSETGIATFEAGERVVLRDGFSVAEGGTLTVVIDSGLAP